jgi:predicted Zn-dependent protease
VWLIGWLAWVDPQASAQRLGESKAVRELWNGGELETLVRGVSARREGVPSPLEAWLAGEALLRMGRLEELAKLEERMESASPRSLVGAFLKYREALSRGDSGRAREVAKERIQRPDVSEYWWGRQPEDWVMLGKLRLEAGEDAKTVLEACYQRAIREEASCEEAYEAIAELAYERGDLELTAAKVREGIEKFPGNPRLLVWQGRTLGGDRPREARSRFEKALERDGGLGLAHAAIAEQAFQMEDAAEFRKHVDRIPRSLPEGEALRLASAIVAGGDEGLEQGLGQYSGHALALQGAGELLAGRYRFEEGATLARAALKKDPGLVAAKRTLAECLLRLAKNEEAWPILEELHRVDGYDVNTFNLLELRDRVAGFRGIQTEHFEIRMSEREAAVFGDRVASLLERAHAALCTKYGARLERRTLVEIFPEQKDFAVRTFGVPGGDGFLGVCFGPVITAPSPVTARAVGHSWEATLWHEFAHTVTLSLTRNRLPRWLSEGISVYEEQQANAGWGQRFKPRYASRLLSGKLTPFESMADAFRTGDGMELDFGYFQAGLMVEWMVREKGMEALKGLLRDLAEGQEIRDSLVKRYGPLDSINAAFAGFALEWVGQASGRLVFRAASEKPSGVLVYEDRVKEAGRALAGKKTEEARRILEELVGAAPTLRDEDGMWGMLARVYRELGLEEAEIGVWERGVRLMSDLRGAHLRLLELHRRWKDWARVEAVGQEALGVRPMSMGVLEALIDAQEALGKRREAFENCKKAMALEPALAPRWHSRMGCLLEPLDAVQARGHLLEALEVNPRDVRALEALHRMAKARESAGTKGGEQ